MTVIEEHLQSVYISEKYDFYPAIFMCFVAAGSQVELRRKRLNLI